MAPKGDWRYVVSNSFRTVLVKRRMAAMAVLVVCSLAGCIEQTTRGNESVYLFAWWVGPTLIVGGILGIPAGWFLRQWNQKLGVALLIIGPVLLLVFAPNIYNDRVLIDDEHFEARYGFWFSPSNHNIRFDDLNSIQYVEVLGRRGRKKYELHCHHKAGSTTIVSAGDLVRPSVQEILARAKAKGVLTLIEFP